jgi:L-alanine-DL-glutamate epimerase-like enolase superfamily enzyme
MSVSRDSEARIERVAVSAYDVPTATDSESDGTLTWSSTTLVMVELQCGKHVGLGYTYSDPATGQVIESKLAPILRQADPLRPGQTLHQMQVAVRQLGHAGVAAMAVSACDVAMWDLKAKLLDVSLADALPGYRESVPAYGSGGFCNYTDEELREQVDGWLAQGFERVKIKVGRGRDLDRVRVVRETAGDGIGLMVDANGANRPQEALGWAKQYRELGVDYFEEPVSSQDVAGLAQVARQAPPGMDIAAGEYGWDIPYFARLLDAEAVHILQADVTRCGGITNLLRIDGLCRAAQVPFSAHCAPAISAHACCGMETALHIEYFFDHSRIEQMLFDGNPDPHDGYLTPDRSRPGLGIELKRQDARRYEV